MAIFGLGRPKITEAKVSSDYVTTILATVHHDWAFHVRNMQLVFEIAGSKKILNFDSFAPYEFTLAVITMQMQELKEHFLRSAAKRIRNQIIQCLQTEEVGSYPIAAIEDYEQEWINALSSNQNPVFALAGVFAEHLQLNVVIEKKGVKYHDPIFLMALASEIVRIGSQPFWKEVTAQYKIVP
jgi:hypothetical protein